VQGVLDATISVRDHAVDDLEAAISDDRAAMVRSALAAAVIQCPAPASARADRHELSGGMIMNVIRHASRRAIASAHDCSSQSDCVFRRGVHGRCRSAEIAGRIHQNVPLAHGSIHSGEIGARKHAERTSCVGRNATTNFEIEWVCATHS